MPNKYNKFSKKRVQTIEQFLHDAELDFHELGILTKFDIEQITNEFVEDSYVAGYKNLLIIVGKGQVVRPEVNIILQTNKFVKAFRKAGYFNGQDGAFEVELID